MTVTRLEGNLDAAGLKFGMVVSRFNNFLTDKLVEGALDCLVRHGATHDDQAVAYVPGALEISAAAARMVAAIIGDKQEVLPCAAYLDGEYGLKDTVIGVPVRLGRKGIEQIVELELTSGERKALAASANAASKLIEAIKPG